MALTAITRDVNAGIGRCELTFLPRTVIDATQAVQQHQDYQSVLSSLGCQIVAIPTEAGLADSVFIEDTALVLDEIAVLCRPGARSRRPEVAGVEAVLGRYRTLASIHSPGTLDGGDLLCIGKTIYAGLSTRSNQSGIKQLRDIVAQHGYEVIAVEFSGCLHLKSAVAEVSPGSLLVNSSWVGKSAFSSYETIDIDKDEPHAANALLLGRSVIYPSSFPRTMDKLLARGIDVIPVDLSELQKAEGAATCCSLILRTQ
jgi:dimethylargininase